MSFWKSKILEINMLTRYNFQFASERNAERRKEIYNNHMTDRPDKLPIVIEGCTAPNVRNKMMRMSAPPDITVGTIIDTELMHRFCKEGETIHMFHGGKRIVNMDNTVKHYQTEENPIVLFSAAITSRNMKLLSVKFDPRKFSELDLPEEVWYHVHNGLSFGAVMHKVSRDFRKSSETALFIFYEGKLMPNTAMVGSLLVNGDTIHAEISPESMFG